MGIRACFVSIACLLTACAGTGEIQSPLPEQRPLAAEGELAPPPPTRRADGDDRNPPENYIVRNYNLTLLVTDPKKAQASALEILDDAHAEITSSEVQEAYAQVSGIVMRGVGENVFRELRALGKVQGETQGHNDMRAAMHELRDKLDQLELADMTLQQAVREATRHDVVDSLVLMLELSRRERENAKSQIRSYQQQARGDQIYISFQTEPLVPDEIQLEPQRRIPVDK